MKKEISIVIINNKNEILLQKRSANKKYFPNKWALLTGHVEENETIEDAAIREIKEEINLNITKKDLNPLKEFNIIKNNSYSSYYYIKCNLKENDFKIQKEELEEVKWYSVDKIINMLNNKDNNLVYTKEKIPLFEYIKSIKN